MLYRVYPGHDRQPLGVRRFEVSWWIVNPKNPPKEGEDWDFDQHLVECFEVYDAQAVAVRRAEELLDKVGKKGGPFFGSIMVVEQVTDWFVEEDGLLEWTNCSTPIEVS